MRTIWLSIKSWNPTILDVYKRQTLASEMQESTRKFKIVADLTNVKTGISEVKLSINNLPSGLTATVNPDKITVKVGKRCLLYTSRCV